MPRPFGILCNNQAGGAGETEPHTASVLRPTVALLTPRTVDQIYFGQSPRIRQAPGFKSDPVKRAGSVQFDRREAWPNVKRCRQFSYIRAGAKLRRVLALPQALAH